jgi:DNA-binding NarL/FixJ family response regulator
MRNCLICDDHALMREAICGMVMQNWPDAQIETAEDYYTAFEKCKLGFELAIVDLAMPGSSPYEGINKLKQLAPSTIILVITGSDDDALMLSLLKLGVAGFVPKSMTGAIIEIAIRLVLAGGQFIPPRLIGLVEEFEDCKPKREIIPRSNSAMILLSNRQKDVLSLVAQGLTNKQIARELGVAPSTIQTHLVQIFRNLNVKTRAEAVHRINQINELS